MSENTLKSLLKGASNDIKTLFLAETELLQLKLSKKVSNALAKSVYGAIIYVTVKLALIFILVSVAFAFALLFIQSSEGLEIVRGILFGFLSLSALLLIVIIVVILIRKTVEESVRSKVINAVLDQLDKQDTKCEELCENDVDLYCDEVDRMEEECKKVEMNNNHITINE